ncbi:MAG: helix-turn-helix transcriptional regulator [Bacilli bacterium]|nr:helix-turn-helix transcriptional regulator [Bacilli bacterium]
MDVLQKIKVLQRERGWSTYRLAYESGITQSTLSNMFTRGTCPTIETLEQICEAFGITLSEFFRNVDDLFYLSKEEKEIIQKYRLLSGNEKKGIGNLITTLVKK